MLVVSCAELQHSALELERRRRGWGRIQAAALARSGDASTQFRGLVAELVTRPETIEEIQCGEQRLGELKRLWELTMNPHFDTPIVILVKMVNDQVG